MVQAKFVKYETLKYLKIITQILDIAKIRENYFLDIANESKFVKYRAENNQLYNYTVTTGKKDGKVRALLCTLLVEHPKWIQFHTLPTILVA